MTKFKIGNLEIKNQIVVAPMAGVTDKAFRKIAEEMEAGLVYTEMISAEALIRENKKTIEMLDISDENIPVAVQLFGEKPEVMSQAAKLLSKYLNNLQLIDINMGCPVPKVAIKSQSGSALMKNPDKIRHIVKSVVEAVDIPVTVKIRSGWDESTINAVEVAKICEQAGAKAIAIHARTRSQGYSGKANWQIIKNVKEAVDIPVIGNGDVTDCYLAKKMIVETGCDAVMIGRGLLGNPWLIKQCVEYLESGKQPLPIHYQEKINMMKKHYEYLLSTKNKKLANLEIRRHILYYLKGFPNGKEIKNKICQAQDETEVFNIIDSLKKYI